MASPVMLPKRGVFHDEIGQFLCSGLECSFPLVTNRIMLARFSSTLNTGSASKI